MFYKPPIYAVLRGMTLKEKSPKLSMFQGFAEFCYSC